MEIFLVIMMLLTIVIGCIMVSIGTNRDNGFLIVTGLAIIAAGIMAFKQAVDGEEVEEESKHYIYIARNIEDLQVDTIHSKKQITDQYVWVNMDSLWVNNSDPYATSYIVIRQITE